MDSPPRLLVLGIPPPLNDRWQEFAQSVPADDPQLLKELLQSGQFAGVLTDYRTTLHLFHQAAQDHIVVGHIDQGLALLDLAGNVQWANPLFQGLCPADPFTRPLLAALGSPTIASDIPDPIAAALSGQPIAFRVSWAAIPSHPHLDVSIRPVLDSAGQCVQFVVLCRNVTAEVEQQRKLDALHQAGRELSGLDPILLAEMNYPSRVELLKQNLRRSIHDLLHYDIIELRLLDRQTRELQPLIEEGMTPEAAGRKLFANPTENGVTGYVASTGRSYLCPDTAADPHYLPGATGARSSMTVPIIYNDEVVGTLNVESPRPAGFGPDDLQFTELFSKEVAAALHTLELLTAQQTCTAAQSLEAVTREIVLPVDEVLGAAALLQSRVGEGDTDTAALLQRIIKAARAVKQNVRTVGESLGAVTPPDAASQPLLGKRVLVVDSDERTRRLAHVMLHRLGAGVETVGTASEGLALLAQTAYDTVLLENAPPDMGGYESYKRFRGTRPQTTIALTTGFGYDSSHSIVKARQDGLQYLLFKPFRQDQVLQSVLGKSTTPPMPSGVR
ncbi:MAG: GAF domain-containing protein [Bacteroidales bacterium]|nr:GAF domain-containing protein [Bacteroidales bacterium]